jgi:uncharacterized glyoxalase superfamily protein PhnB
MKTVARTIGIVDVMKAEGGAWDGMTLLMEAGVNQAMKILDRVVWDINHINRHLATSLRGRIMDRALVNKVHHTAVKMNNMAVKAILSDNLVNVSNGPIANGEDSPDTRIIHTDNSMLAHNMVMVSKDNPVRVGDNITKVGVNITKVNKDNTARVGDNTIRAGVNITRDNKDNTTRDNKDNTTRAGDNTTKVGDNTVRAVANMIRVGVSKTN